MMGGTTYIVSITVIRVSGVRVRRVRVKAKIRVETEQMTHIPCQITYGKYHISCALRLQRRIIINIIPTVGCAIHHDEFCSNSLVLTSSNPLPYPKHPCPNEPSHVAEAFLEMLH